MEISGVVVAFHVPPGDRDPTSLEIPVPNDGGRQTPLLHLWWPVVRLGRESTATEAEPRSGSCRVLGRNKGMLPAASASSSSWTETSTISCYPRLFHCSLATKHVPRSATLVTTRIMPSSKFTEILDPQFQSTSLKSDVRLEDLIAASDTSGRGRTSSETSSRSESSSGSRTQSGDRTEAKRKQRLSRLLSIAKR